MITTEVAETSALYPSFVEQLQFFDDPVNHEHVTVTRLPLKDKPFSMTTIEAVSGLGHDEAGSELIRLVVYRCFEPNTDVWFFQFAGDGAEAQPIFWVHPTLGIRTDGCLDNSLELSLELAESLLNTLRNARLGYHPAE